MRCSSPARGSNSTQRSRQPMGLSFGTATSGSSSNTNSNSNTSNTYAPGQTNLQSELGSVLGSDLAGSQTGALSPGTLASETGADDTINKTASGLTGRVNNFLASRGY